MQSLSIYNLYPLLLYVSLLPLQATTMKIYLVADRPTHNRYYILKPQPQPQCEPFCSRSEPKPKSTKYEVSESNHSTAGTGGRLGRSPMRRNISNSNNEQRRLCRQSKFTIFGGSSVVFYLFLHFLVVIFSFVATQ